MDTDLDEKLYNDYLNGDKELFEYFYKKYKNKIEYFVFNILKDYQKAEDITQETFIYVMQNKKRENCSFKHYIYLVARSRAYNYISLEKRRTEITEQHFGNKNGYEEEDIVEIIAKEENKTKLLNCINELDENYKNAIYLTYIENLSYKETAEILGQSLQNTKNLIHRGKKKLRKILLKKGFNQMNKVSKVIIILLLTTIAIGGVVYAVTKIYKEYNTHHQITMNPAYQSSLNKNTINNLWVGTLDLAWKDLEEKLGLDKIELVTGDIQIVKDLNSSVFSKEMLDSKDYEIKVERTLTNGYKIDATLNKELNFLEIFDNFSNDYKTWTFGNGEEYIKYFGINNGTFEECNKNIEVLFYTKTNNSSISNDFAIKLKTKEGDEIILYRTDEVKSFDEYYRDIQEKTNSYIGEREFTGSDELFIPYVKVNGIIAYNELYGKTIKNTKGLFFTDVIQNVNFSLNEKGCDLRSEATLITEYLGINDSRKFNFKDKFVIFMKEENCENPYFALKVDNDDILEKIDEIEETIIIDYTKSNSHKYKIENGEYKFYEDEDYEYYFLSKKLPYVRVYFTNGDSDTVEYALKQNKIQIELLDKYGIEYVKKEK